MPLTIVAAARYAACLAALSAAPLLAGCVTDGPKNALGGTVSYNEPVAITPDKADTNVAALIDLRRIGKIERRIRDNHLIVERFSLLNANGGAGGYIYVQRTPNAFFGPSTVNDLEKLAEFQERVAEILKTQGYVSQAAAEKLQNKRARATIGYKTVAQRQPGSNSCFVARAGYRLDLLTMYDNDWGAPDTVVETVYCDSAANFAQFNELMAGFGIMQPIEASGIQAKMAAAPAASAAPRAPAANPSPAPATVNNRLAAVNDAKLDCQAQMRSPDLAAISDKVELFPMSEAPPPSGIATLKTYANTDERLALKRWIVLLTKCQERLALLEMAARQPSVSTERHMITQSFNGLFNTRLLDLATVLSESRITYAEYALTRWDMVKDLSSARLDLARSGAQQDAGLRARDDDALQAKFQRNVAIWTGKIQEFKARTAQIEPAGAASRPVAAVAPAAPSSSAPAPSASAPSLAMAAPLPKALPGGPLSYDGQLAALNSARTDCQNEIRNADLALIRDKVELFSVTEAPPPAHVSGLSAYPAEVERIALKHWIELAGKCRQRLAPLEMAARPTGAREDVHVAEQSLNALFHVRASELAVVLSDSRITYAEYASARWRMAKETADARTALSMILLKDPQRRVVDVKNIQDKFQRAMDDWSDKIRDMKARPIQVGSKG